jgi:hypothetical protein
MEGGKRVGEQGGDGQQRNANQMAAGDECAAAGCQKSTE